MTTMGVLSQSELFCVSSELKFTEIVKLKRTGSYLGTASRAHLLSCCLLLLLAETTQSSTTWIKTQKARNFLEKMSLH